MPQNPTQFQHGMSLNEFMQSYGTEAQCEAALLQARWPDGFVCPECGGRAHSTFVADERQYWQCSHCRSQRSLRLGTLFHASKLLLTTWFRAIYLVTQNKNCISALSFKRHLGVSYRTAWRVKHKLFEAMAEREDHRRLSGVVVADDAYLGGKHAGKRGRGSENKVPFIAAVELDDDGHPQHVRFDPIPDLKAASVVAWASAALAPSVQLITDGFASLGAAASVVDTHGAIIVSPRQSSEIEMFRWVNTFIANLKTAIRGTYHHFKFRKYTRRYLAEAQYRVYRGFDLRLLVGRLLHASAHAEPCPEHWLRLGVARAA